MYLRIPAGTTSKLIEFPVYDSSSTIGALLAGLTYNSSGMTAYYDLWGASGSANVMSLVTMTKGTWTSLGFVAVDATNMPGMYQLGIPNAVLTGAAGVTIYLKGATNMVSVVLVIELTSATDYPANMQQILGTAVSTPATAGILDVNVKNIVNAAAAIDGNNLLKVDLVDIAGAAVATGSAQLGVNVVNIAGQAAALDANNLLKVDLVDIAGAAVATGTAQLGVNVVTQANIDFGATQKASITAAVPTAAAIQSGLATPTNITAGTITTVTNLTNAPTAGDLTATMKTSVTTACTAATPTVTAGTVSDKTGYALTAGEHTNIGTDVYGQLNTAVTDATSLNANSLLDRLRSLGWIIRNQIAITDASGAGTIYKDDSATTAFSVSLTDNSTTTTRTRAA